MRSYILKGHLCTSEDRQHIRVVENGCLVCENGVITGVYEQLPEQYANLPLVDFGDRLIIPGMTDLHIHAPQFAFRGLGMDMELLDWLNTHTFPEEAKYAELSYADRAYTQFADHLRRSVTTRAVVFGTIHVPATELLMDKLEAAGLYTYVGKVNMNRNSPDYLCEKSVPQALADTEQWICHTRERYEHTKPILTPRFIPSCTDELMQGLHGLQQKYALPVQSHLSENYSEIAWVQELCPASRFYGDAYDRFGMFGGGYGCIMAHCVHSCDEEVELMRKNGVFVAHSPESNINLASGVAPISRYLELGLNVGLATDVAGGSHESMLRAVMHAVQASKLRWRLLDENVKPLTFDEAFYLATAGGGAFFGKVGCFRPGYAMDAVVLDDSNLEHPQPLTVKERLERMAYLADERNNYAKFVAGERLF
ncbi:MAG: amidohydrolase family protein [Faecousia sp.]